MKDIRPTTNPEILRVMREFREIDIPAIRDGFMPEACRMTVAHPGRRSELSRNRVKATKARRKAEDGA